MVLVHEVMTTDIVSINVEETLQAAVELLLEHDIGSVVVTRDGDPAGLVTETDALTAAARTGKPLAELSLEPFCEGGVVTTQPDRTVSGVADRMLEEGIKKLPVMEELELVGIVTLTDIVYHLSDFRAEARALTDQYYDWHS